jgi:cell volume regulation protein A
VAGPGLVTALVLMLIARPVSVFLALAPSALRVREKTMIAWVGLRGAVPIILATFPLLAGVPRAEDLFDLVFFVVLTSVVLQGTSIPAVARWLEVDAPMDEPPGRCRRRWQAVRAGGWRRSASGPGPGPSGSASWT